MVLVIFGILLAVYDTGGAPVPVTTDVTWIMVCCFLTTGTSPPVMAEAFEHKFSELSV